MSKPRVFDHAPQVRVRTMIHVRFARGEGVKDDPVRKVDRFYFDDGQLAAEVDPCSEASQQRAERGE